MSYKAFLNNTDLIFDTELQEDTILMIDPDVQIEAGTAGSFEFTMPATHKKYGQLKRSTDYIDVYRNGETDPLFSGRVYQIQDLMNGCQKIKCEGAMTFLSDTVFRPVTFQGYLHTLVSNIITSHNGQVEAAKQITIGNITVDNSNVYREYLNYETSISRIKDLVDSFGGYLMLRKHSGTYYLDWLEDFTTPCTQEIRLASNLLNIKKTIDSNGIATVVIPLGAKDGNGDRLTIKSVNSNLDYLTAGSSYISEYGYITKVVIWDDVTTASALKSKGQTYLAAALTPRMNISLSAVDLADAGYSVDSFQVGQKIAVLAPQQGINSTQFSCVKQRLKLLNPGQNKMELGEVRTGYVQLQKNTDEQMLLGIAKQIEHSEDVMQQAINTTSALITGNSGGYVVIHDSNGDSHPDEILIMDTDNINTAVKVLRINKNGIGFSSNGYNGTYTTAWTLNGAFDASFITTGTLVASIIKAGILQALHGNSFWNLDTGELYIEGDLTMLQSQTGGGGTNIDLTAISQNGIAYTYGGGVPPWRIPTKGNFLGYFTNFWKKDKSELYATISRTMDKYGYMDITVVRPRYARQVVLDTELGDYSNSMRGCDIQGNLMSKDTTWVFREHFGSPAIYFHVYKGSEQASQASSGTVSSSKNTIGISVAPYSISLGSKDPDRTMFDQIQAELTIGEKANRTGNLFFCQHSCGYIAIGRRSGSGTDRVQIEIDDGSAVFNGRTVAYQGSSSIRYKHDIAILTDEQLDPHKLYDLQLKQFRFNKGHKVQYKDLEENLIPGFLAEDVAQIYPGAVIHNQEGQIESWDERRILPGMLKLIQEQHDEIEELKKQIKELKEVVECIS